MSLTDVETKINATRTKARTVIAGYKGAIDGLKNDPSRTDDYRRTHGRELYQQASRDLKNLMHEEIEAIDAGIASRTKTLFGNSGTLSGMDAIAQRDADERVSKIRDHREAETMMQRALQNQDSILARALFARSLEYGFRGAVNAYTAANENASGKYDEIAELERLKALGPDLERQMLYSAISPAY